MAITKPAGTWTYDDLLLLPANGTRYEIIEGELYEMPSPTSAHARVIINLIALLLPIVARLRGQLFTAPLDVFVPGGDPVQPDILLLLPASPARVEMRGVVGAPDLIVEIVSPSNRGRDLLLKRALYARAGVREYWLVDPQARSIEVLALAGEAYHRIQAAESTGTITSPLLDDAEIALVSVFAGIEDIEG
jgi:Uma2 family endonuclease